MGGLLGSIEEIILSVIGVVMILFYGGIIDLKLKSKEFEEKQTAIREKWGAWLVFAGIVILAIAIKGLLKYL